MLFRRYLPLALAFLVPALLFIAVARTSVEPWGDEAMLLANLLLPDLDVLAPLPLYEQAAPVGYLWLSQVLLDLFGSDPPFQVLRFLSAAFMGAGIALLLTLRPVRSDALVASILVAVLLGEPMIWTYANEIKHYSAEFFASALVLACGLPLAHRNDLRAYGLFLAAVAVAGLVSFTVPVIVAGLLAALALYRLFAKQPRAGAFEPAFIVTGALAVLYVAAVYLLLNRGLVVWQLQAYAHVYQPPTDQGLASLVIKRIGGVLQVLVNAVGSTWLSATQGLLHQIGVPLGLSFHAIRLIALALFAVAAVLAFRRAPEVVAMTLGVFAAMAALHFSGFLDMPYERHAIFLIPFSSTLTAIAVGSLLLAIVPVAGRPVIAGLALVAGVIFGAQSTLGRQTQEIGKLLAHIHDTAPDVPVWVHSAGQPVFDVLSPQPAEVLARMDSTSGPVAWEVRGGGLLMQDGRFTPNPDYPQSLAVASAGLPELWLLFDNDASTDEYIDFLKVAEQSVGPCKAVIQETTGSLFFCARSS
jgi:hypothetical protein